MNQIHPKIKNGKINNVIFIKNISVIHLIPNRFINENTKVGIIKYSANLGKKRVKSRKRWSKILPNLLCAMLSKNFFIIFFFHQIVWLFFGLKGFLRSLNQQIL